MIGRILSMGVLPGALTGSRRKRRAAQQRRDARAFAVAALSCWRRRRTKGKTRGRSRERARGGGKRSRSERIRGERDVLAAPRVRWMLLESAAHAVAEPKWHVTLLRSRRFRKRSEQLIGDDVILSTARARRHRRVASMLLKARRDVDGVPVGASHGGQGRRMTTSSWRDRDRVRAKECLEGVPQLRATLPGGLLRRRHLAPGTSSRTS